MLYGCYVPIPYLSETRIVGIHSLYSQLSNHVRNHECLKLTIELFGIYIAYPFFRPLVYMINRYTY